MNAPVAPRDDLARARGLPLAAARRVGAPQHQREPVRAAAPSSSSAGSTSCATRRSTATPTARRAALRDALGAAPRPAGRAALLRQRLQRGAADAAPHLRRARAGASSMFEPTYALHSHIARITGTEVVMRRAATDFFDRSDVASACALVARRRPVDRVRVQPQQPDRHRRAGGDHRGAARRRRVGPRRRRRGLRRVRAAERARAASTTTAARRRAHVLEGVVDGRAAARASRSRRRGSIEELEKVVLPYHLSVPTQDRRADRARAGGDEMDDRVDAPGRRARAGARARSPRSTGSPCSRRAPTSCCSASHGDGHALWQRLVDRGVLVRDFSSWPRLDGVPAGHHRHARGERRVPRRAPTRRSGEVAR